MADISLQRKHKLGLKKAKEAAQKVADELAESFDMESEWEGNTLSFERSGVSGKLVVTKDGVVVDAKLGFLLSAFKPKIEEQINKNFDRYFT
jgi:putative polyhydroxyalkanoate system protein